MSQLAKPMVSSQARRPALAGQTAAIFLISVLGLFLELLLIRWVSTEIRIFAYMQNTVLVVCFMGLGMGCWTCSKPFSLRAMLLPLFILVTLLGFPMTRIVLEKIVMCVRFLEESSVWSEAFRSNALGTIAFTSLGVLVTFLLLVLLWDIFVPIGRLLGQLLNAHPQPIWAYSVNVAGSLVGIWLFVGLSAWYQPPLTWFAVVVAVCLCFLNQPAGSLRGNGLLLAGILGFAWLAGYEPGWSNVTWSPYQKLALQQTAEAGNEAETPHAASWWFRDVDPYFEGIGERIVLVNNGGYQTMINLDEEHTRAHPERYAPALQGLSQYDIPLLLHPKPQKVLMVGSGTGNDVAGGLRHKVAEITAVDIDPAIIELGRLYHPEQPYASPRVRVVNDDARSFFATSTDRYDMIVFGLLDSHTTTARVSERLDHYVYTRESLQQARSLLADGGILVLSFEILPPFSPDRMNAVLREVFQQDPVSFRVPRSAYGWGGVMFVAGDLSTVERQMAANGRLRAQIEEWRRNYPVSLPGITPAVTDDWPYIYLQTPHIPMLYYFLAGMLALLFLFGLRRLQTPGLLRGWARSHWHFFFMGAAFLLLEVQNISKASVVLGNTWLVNAVIISGILAMVLLANWIVTLFPRLSLGPVYALLCGTCLALYFVDLARFGFLPYATKAAIVGGLTSLPMLFSGVVFIRSFAGVAGKDRALGANLIGALVGGVLQSLTFLVGIKALLLIVAALYLAAWLTRPAVALVPKVIAPDPLRG